MRLLLQTRRALILLVAVIICLASGAKAAVPGVSPQRIHFGQSAAFTGPARALGEEMRLGIEAAFRAVNVRGGVYGRRLELTSLDDAYEPEAAILNTRRLIEHSKVFALIGAVGTPTSRSATPVAAKAGVPYIAPFTGAAFLRDSKWKNIINLRASYFQETEEMVNRLIKDLGVKKIAVLYQDDSFGLAGYRGVRRALERRNLKPVVTGVYPRNTTAVKTALLDIRRADPGAVVLVGAYKPVAAFIAWARHTGFNPIFVTIS
ncbi:MAG: ABC transporter substrate-binding protein, partial [Nitrospinae bacterium]|nr:ABC transporter substrate-binding protein [Nitrospinota bacterium]